MRFKPRKPYLANPQSTQTPSGASRQVPFTKHTNPGRRFAPGTPLYKAHKPPAALRAEYPLVKYPSTRMFTAIASILVNLVTFTELVALQTLVVLLLVAYKPGA